MRTPAALALLLLLCVASPARAGELLDAISLAQSWHASSSQLQSFRATVVFSRQEKAHVGEDRRIASLEQNQWPAPLTYSVEWVVDVPTTRYKCVVSDLPGNEVVFSWSNTQNLRESRCHAIYINPGTGTRAIGYAAIGPEEEIPPRSGATPESCPLSLMSMDPSSLGQDLRFGMAPVAGPNRDNVFCIAGDQFEAIGTAAYCQRLSLLVRQVGTDQDSVAPQCVVWLDHEQAFLPVRIECYTMGKLTQQVKDIQYLMVDGVLAPVQGTLECYSPDGVPLMSGALACHYSAVNTGLGDDDFRVSFPIGQPVIDGLSGVLLRAGRTHEACVKSVRDELGKIAGRDGVTLWLKDPLVSPPAADSETMTSSLVELSDCGPAALYFAGKLAGMNVEYPAVRDRLGQPHGGVSMETMIQAAKSLGFTACEPVSTDLDQLKAIGAPAIILTKVGSEQRKLSEGHYCLAVGHAKDGIVVVDVPGRVSILSESSLAQSWSGYAILLAQSPITIGDNRGVRWWLSRLAGASVALLLIGTIAFRRCPPGWLR